MTAIGVSRNARRAIQIAQWIRNGQPVESSLQNKLADGLNYAAFVRPRCVYRSPGALSTAGGASMIPGSVATRERGRFAWHSSPFAAWIYVEFEMALEQSTASDPYCTCEVSTNGIVLGTAFMHAGSNGGLYSDVPVAFGGGITVLQVADGDIQQVLLTPDTEYQAVIKDIGYARLQSIAVWEVSLSPNTNHGYALSSHTAGGSITDEDREVVLEGARALHTRGAAQLWNWHPIQGSGARTLAGSAGVTGQSSWTLGALTAAGTGTVAGTATFDATVNTYSGPTTNHDPVDFTISAVAGGAAQNNGVIYLAVQDNYGFNVIGNVSTLALAGWSETGWSFAGGIWSNQLTKSSVAVGTTSPQFRITTGLNTGWIYIYTNYPAAPQTDEDAGPGNAISVHLHY